jgi:hypothetical protein
MQWMNGSSSGSTAMGKDVTPVKFQGLDKVPAVFLQTGVILLAGFAAIASPAPKERADQGHSLAVRLDAPVSDVTKAVQQVTQDQIIHGTYSYEKERILYGAHSADSSRAFGKWQGPGKAFYKVASDVLAPRNFKNTGDIGNITVRYLVQDVGAGSASVQIDAVFIDARNARHPSEGDVEQAEYAAILKQLTNIQAARQKPAESSPAVADQHVVAELPPQPAATRSSPSPLLQQSSSFKPLPNATDSSTSELSVPDLEKRVQALRHEVELRVKDSGAALKASPFRSSATLLSLPAQSPVVILVLTPYWYGVETEDGHHGWVYHGQLEPLP